MKNNHKIDALINKMVKQSYKREARLYQEYMQKLQSQWVFQERDEVESTPSFNSVEKKLKKLTKRVKRRQRRRL